MTDHPAKPGPGVDGQNSEFAATFNAASAKSREVEIKFLVPQPDDGGVDYQVFRDIKEFFQKNEWTKFSKENHLLLTRQLDTPNQDLLQKGVTVRIRGNCANNNLRKIPTPDICVKMGKTLDESGAVHRGEFESRIPNFEHIDLRPLLDKYPKEDYPQLHEALEGLKPSTLREFFRIDCIRHRYLVEFPEEVTGLKGKRSVVELLLDDVAFVLDLAPGKRPPLVFHHDLEVEFEALFKPCDYDFNPNAKNYVSSPMTADELKKLMAIVRDQTMLASGNTLQPNSKSKAERGFENLEETLSMLHDYIETSACVPKKARVQSAFAMSANPASEKEELHTHLHRDLGQILRQRPVACYPPFNSVK